LSNTSWDGDTFRHAHGGRSDEQCSGTLLRDRAKTIWWSSFHNAGNTFPLQKVRRHNKRGSTQSREIEMFRAQQAWSSCQGSSVASHGAILSFYLLLARHRAGRADGYWFVDSGASDLRESLLDCRSLGIANFNDAAVPTAWQQPVDELFYKSLLLIGYSYQGEILSRMDDQNAALKRYSQSRATATGLAQNKPQDLESLLSIAQAPYSVGVVLSKTRRYPEAQAELRTSLKRSDDLLRARPQDAEILYVSKMTHDYLATLNRCSPGRECAQAAGTQSQQLESFASGTRDAPPSLTCGPQQDCVASFPLSYSTGRRLP
jgi:hypothetical protein